MAESLQWWQELLPIILGGLVCCISLFNGGEPDRGARSVAATVEQEPNDHPRCQD